MQQLKHIIFQNLLNEPRISQTLVKMPIFKTFGGKFSILAYILLKIVYFERGHDYDITVMLVPGTYLSTCMERGDP